MDLLSLILAFTLLAAEQKQREIRDDHCQDASLNEPACYGDPLAATSTNDDLGEQLLLENNRVPTWSPLPTRWGPQP